MPFKSFGLACIVITFVSTPADAQNVDFAKLLGTINYPEQEEADAESGAAPVEAAPEIAVPEEADSEDVAPEDVAPKEAAPDASAPQPIPRLPGAKLSEYGEIRGEPVDPLLADDPLLSDESPLSGESVLSDDLPQQTEPPAAGDEVTGEPEPRAAVDAGAAPRQDPPSGRVDFSAILDDPTPAGAAALPQPPAQPMATAPGAYHAQFAAHPSAPPCECDKCRDALPLVPYLEHVDLPPPTTLEGYYRTPACYRGLWSGYEQQRQRECQRRHKHLPGHMRVPMH